MSSQTPLPSLEEKEINIHDVKLHYHFHIREGSKNLILVHGIGVSSRYMLPLAAELSTRHTVYAIDLPGFGKSERFQGPYSLEAFAESLREFIVKNSIASPTLIGNSFGCQVIIKLLKMHPGIADSAVLLGPTMNIYERSRIKQMARWVHNLKYEPTRKLAWILIKDLVECGPFRVLRTLDIGVKDKPEIGLEKVKVPILFMRGELDPIAPKKWVEFLATLSPLFSSGQLPQAGHALNYNSPKPLAKIIDDFIDISNSI